MDGSSKDRRINGKLFRPVSLSQALDQFPQLIYDMISRKSRVMVNSAADGIFSVLIYGRDDKFWTLRLEDYDKCLSISRKFSSPILFPSSREATYDQIRAYIMVEFKDRE